MWSIRVLMDTGETVELPTRSVTGRHLPFRDVIRLARDLAEDANGPVPWHLLEAAANGPPTPWADAIAVWASRLTKNDAGINATPSPVEGQVLQLEGGGITAGHLPTVVVAQIPMGATQLGVWYEWDDDIPYLPLRHLPTFDARLYAGEKSAIYEVDALPIDWSVPTEILADKKPTFRWLFGVARRAGILIGRLVHRTFLRDVPPITRDPGFLVRLNEEEGSAPQAFSCPRIHDYAPSDASLSVVIHGTFSCSVNIATRLQEVCPDVGPIVRFEHDTFLPVLDNVDDLVTELSRLADGGVTSFWLISHSRGGLVAGQAASQISRLRPSLHLSVWTFGTPHHGTPLAGVGGVAAQAFGALYRLCARPNGCVFHATYVEGAASYLVSMNQLPPGVAVMREGSDFLELHRKLMRDLSDLHTVGAWCSAAGGSGLGHGLLLHPAVDEVFSNRDHDLVVPTESAILDDSPPFDNCNHFQYFDRLVTSMTEAWVAARSDPRKPVVGASTAAVIARRDSQRQRALEDPTQGL